MDHNAFYPYQLVKKQALTDNLFKSIEQYKFRVSCLNRTEKLDYLLNFYLFNSYMYITDFFPAVWEKDPDCFKKLTSSEGFLINIRKTILSCFYIYHREINPSPSNKAMVLSGSYLTGEEPLPEIGISRKLKIYREIFKPLVNQYNYRFVDIFEKNAVIVVKQNSKPDDIEIISDYLSFKEKSEEPTEK